MSHVTIKDVAKAANVSITTVSLVLNNKAESISKETVELVQQVCRDLNYQRNYFASSLKSKVTNTIGLILPHLDSGYYSHIASCLDTILFEKGYTLLVASSDNDFEKEMNLFKQMEARQVDYLVILPSSKSLLNENKNVLHDVLKHLSIKYVVLDRRTGFNDHIEVVNDDYYGASLAVEHLIKCGHKRIACITGPNNVSSSDERLRGYKDVLKKNGISFDQSLIYEGDYTFNTAREISKKIIKRNDIDAVFAFNDMSAYALYDIYVENDKKIGRDISVVGFDDNPFSSLISPSLTTVKQDIHSICYKAIDELLKDNSKNKMIKILPTLVERKSVCVK